MAIKAYKELYIFFPTNRKSIDLRINKEIKHIIDVLFYADNKTKLNERLQIYNIISEMLKEEKKILRSFDLLLILNKHYIFYDFKNYIIKKIPRIVKHKILNKYKKRRSVQA